MVKITTRQQFELLVQHMKANPNIARGMRTFGPNKATTEELWKEVAQNLNSCGPPTRTPDEWQRVWIHFKAKLKKKLTQNKRNSMTDGGTSQEVILSPLEQAAADLLQIELTVGNAFGVFEVFDIEEPSETEPNVEIEELKECKQPKMYNIQHTSSKRVNTDDRKVAILQEQADTQTEILNTLKKLKRISARKMKC